MERILVGIDDEKSSDAAVRWVIDRAEDSAVEIRLATCIDVLMFMDRTMEEARLDACRRLIEDAVPAARVTTSMPDGPIHDVLVAASEDFDLLVVGFRPSHPVLTALAGSIAARVAAHAHCATVIVPEGWEHSRATAVVVGVSDDASDVVALDWAVREAARTRRELVVVHAWQLPQTGWDPLVSLVTAEDETREHHRALLKERLAPIRLRNPDLRVREEVVMGGPATVLLTWAGEARVFVIGTHGRGPISGLILGSTAHELLPHSTVPVCVVPLGAPA